MQIDYTDDGTNRWDYYYDTNGNMIKKELFGSDPVHKTDLDYDFLNMMKDFDNSLDETRHGQYNNDDTGFPTSTLHSSTLLALCALQRLPSLDGILHLFSSPVFLSSFFLIPYPVSLIPSPGRRDFTY